MGFKTNFGNILLGAGNQVIDTMNIEAAREADQTRRGIAEATSQWNSTLKKNKQAHENYIEFLNFIKSHPDQFTGNWDRRLSALYQDKPSLFKGESFDAIKDNVAKALSTYKIREEKLGEEVESPYVSSADYFNANQDSIRDHIGTISGMNNVVNLMTSEKEFAKSTTDLSGFEQLEGTLDKEIAIATMTAYGYGILRQDPTSPYTQKLLEIEKLRIISSNAQKFTNENEKRTFLLNALQKNVIDLADVYMFTKPINARALLTVFDNQLKGEMEIINASLKNYQRLNDQFQNKDPNVTSEMLQAAKNDYEIKRDSIFPKVNKILNETIGSQLPFDVGQVQVKEEPKKIEEPQKIEVPEDYNPRINSRGEINLIDGSKVSIEDILADIETYKKTQPPEFINYISQFSPLFDDDGDMIEPTRDMFTPGKTGNKLFRKFTNIYKALNPDKYTEIMPGAYHTKGDYPDTTGNVMEDIKKLLTAIKESGQIKEKELKEIKPKKKK